MNRFQLSSGIVAALIVVGLLAMGVTAVSANTPDTSVTEGISNMTTENATDTKSYIIMDNVRVSPENPTTESNVVLTTSITNAESANGGAEITEVSITGSSTFVTADDIGTLGPGTSVEIPLSTSFESTGQKRLTVTVRGYNADGQLFVNEKPIYVTVDSASHSSDIYVTDNATSSTKVTLSNYGNLNFTSVEVAAIAGSETLDQRHLPDIKAGSSASTTFDTEDYNLENVTFEASYTAGGTSYQTTRSATLKQEIEGEIQLTSVSSTQTGSTVTLDGDAANIGGTDVDSVLVSVQDTDSVTPTSGSGEYFVGSVDASEFATFELGASVNSSVSSIPVEITYIVDNERVTTTQQVALDSASSAAAASENQQSGASSGAPDKSGSGLLPVPIAIGVVVLVTVGGGLYYLWNRE